jgi:hypothetical protein
MRIREYLPAHFIRDGILAMVGEFATLQVLGELRLRLVLTSLSIYHGPMCVSVFV